MTRMHLLLTSLLALGTVTVAIARPLAAQDQTQKQFVAPHILERFAAVIDEAPPSRLTAADQQQFAAQTVWLKSVRARLQALDGRAGVISAREFARGQSSGRQQAPNPAAAAELAALLQTIEQEARQFNTLSNASKARHDLAMSIIANLKG